MPLCTGATILKEVVEPDSTLDYFLDNPREAFERIFGDSKNKRKPEYSEEEWRTHIFSQKSVIAKLCAWANSSRGFLDILAELDKAGAGPKKKKKYKNARV